MMKKKIKIIMAALLICVLTIPVLAGPLSAKAEANTNDPLKYFLFFNEKEKELQFLVLNPTQRAVDLYFPTGKDFDLDIRQNGQTVWQASDGQGFTMAIREESLGPGQSKFYRVSLPKLSDGKYEVLAYFEGGPSRGKVVAKLELKLGQVVEDTLQYNLSYNKDTREITYVVKNISKKTVSFTFNGGKKFDLVVSDKAGKKVWQLSDGQAYTKAIFFEELAPGQSKTYQATLPQLKPGEYTVEAYFAAVGYDHQANAVIKVMVEAQEVLSKLGFKTLFIPSKQPKIGFFVKNLTNETIKLEFPSSQTIDVVVKGDNGYRWQYSQGKIFTQALEVREIKPGTIRYNFISLPKMPTGKYTAEIYYLGVSADKPVSSTSFVVK